MTRLRHAAAIAACLGLCHCGASSGRGGASQVRRERRVQTGERDLDPFFTALYGYQYALGSIDLRRADAMASFARALDLRENADRATLALALHAEFERVGVARIRAAITASPDAPSHLDAWYSAVTTAPAEGEDMAASIRARYAALAADITVTLTPDIPAPTLAPLLEHVASLLRDAETTRRCMERLAQPLPSVLSQATELRRGAPPDHAAELEAGHRVLLGVRARATLHAQESVRIERWLLGTLMPDAEETPPDAEAGERLDVSSAPAANWTVPRVALNSALQTPRAWRGVPEVWTPQ